MKLEGMPSVTLIAFLLICVSGQCCAATKGADTGDRHKLPQIRLALAVAVPQAVPDKDLQKAALDLVKHVYAKAYAQRADTEKRALAGRLLAEASGTQDLPSARYVMLMEAGRLSASCGDATGAIRAADALAQWYQVDEITLKMQWLSAAKNSATSTEATADAATCCLSVLQQAIEVDDFSHAHQLIGMGQAFAQRGRSIILITQFKQWDQELQLLQGLYQQYQQARVKLDENPDDPSAIAIAGKYLCIAKGDWDKGLALLSRGGDPSLAKVAQQDLLNPADADTQASVGHLWWGLSFSEGRIVSQHLQQRAAFWYRKARTDLTGLSATLVDQRLAELDEKLLKRQRLEHGLSAELFGDREFGHLVLRRVDKQINFDFGDQPADEGMPKDDFSIRWTGLLRIEQPGDYTFVVIANSSARLTVNQVVLLDEPDLTRKRAGQRVSVHAEAAMYPFTFGFSDHGGLAKAQLFWITPGQTQPVAIPPEAFVHAR